MNNKHFTTLYNDHDFVKTLETMAERYYLSYRKKWETISFDVEDIKQELWINVYESDVVKKPLLVNRIKNKIHEMLRSLDSDIHAIDDVDIESLGYENENGEIESADETMSRLVYHGKGRYV